MIEIRVLASSSSGNCYRVTDGSTPLLVECGLPLAEIRRRLDFRLHQIAACLVSHEHQDHAKAVPDLVRRIGIECVMSPGTAKALDVSGCLVRTVPALVQFRIDTWTALPFRTQHDAADPVGFLLAAGGEKLVYITDSFYCRYRFRGLTHIMIECNYARDILDRNVAASIVPEVVRDRTLRSHFSLEHVKEFLAANDLSVVREIHLLHLSDGNSDAARFKREIQELTGRPVYVAERR